MGVFRVVYRVFEVFEAGNTSDVSDVRINISQTPDSILVRKERNRGNHWVNTEKVKVLGLIDIKVGINFIHLGIPSEPDTYKRQKVVDFLVAEKGDTDRTKVNLRTNDLGIIPVKIPDRDRVEANVEENVRSPIEDTRIIYLYVGRLTVYNRKIQGDRNTGNISEVNNFMKEVGVGSWRHFRTNYT